jgi:hypothetical protein
MKLEFSRQIFEKYSNTKSHENPPLGAELIHVDKQTDRHKEAYSHFSQFCEGAYKYKLLCYISKISLRHFGLNILPFLFFHCSGEPPSAAKEV